MRLKTELNRIKVEKSKPSQPTGMVQQWMVGKLYIYSENAKKWASATNRRLSWDCTTSDPVWPSLLVAKKTMNQCSLKWTHFILYASMLCCNITVHRHGPLHPAIRWLLERPLKDYIRYSNKGHPSSVPLCCATESWTTTIILRPLYRTTCVSQFPQLRTGRFCWCKGFLSTCPCWQKLAHLD